VTLAHTAAAQLRQAPRAVCIDAVRGLVIAIMALDHTREFFHSAAMRFLAEDFTQTWPALFLTRWITHICAPAFMLLAGVSAFLWKSRGHTARELSCFLVKRGLWLIVLDVTVMRFAMFFSLTSAPIILSVLWALGWSMIVLAGLVHLPVRLLAPLSIAAIILHNLTDTITAAQFGSAAWLWNLLHQPGAFSAGGVTVLVAYPLVPWVAVMACGYCLGPLFRSWTPDDRRRVLLKSGIALTVAFLVLRAINRYGDPSPWNPASDFAVLSFLNTTKYPPSLQFLLMTLGPVLILLAAFDSRRMSRANPLIAFGRTPLFFFVAHFYLIHALTFPFAAVRYGDTAFLWQPAPSMGGSLDTYPAGYGWNLVAVYLVWMLVLCLMYPVCHWFAALKERRRTWWLAYL
jgi:uncharacterized membrane protein